MMNKLRYILSAALLLPCAVLLCAATAVAQEAAPLWSVRMADAHGVGDFKCNTKTQESMATAGWDYVTGLVACSLLKTWEYYPTRTEYYKAVKAFADNSTTFDAATGKVTIHKAGSSSDALGNSNVDNLASGKVYMPLYREALAKGNTADAAKYKAAATKIRNKLKNEHTRIAAGLPGVGGFIHKASYPNQMWLDGLYMGAAFYAEWQAQFGHELGADDNSASWADIAKQFKIINEHTYDTEKGLNYHGWSATPSESDSFWANPMTGCSPEFWGRGMGWFFAALVDVVELMPKDHADYQDMLAILRQVAAGLARYQDPNTGVWYQLLQYDASVKADGNGDKIGGSTYNKGTKANYPEASCSSMFTYCYLKALRLGLLDEGTYRPIAQKAYEGLLAKFITTNGNAITIGKSCASAGLGPASNPGRTGTINYYLCGSDVSQTSNEGKAIGPFVMASVEYERYQNSLTGYGPPAAPDETGIRQTPIAGSQRIEFDAPADGIYLFKTAAGTLKRRCRAGRNAFTVAASVEAVYNICGVRVK